MSLDHVEALECRLLLASPLVVDVTPASNSHVAPDPTELRILFDQDVDLSTAPVNSLVVRAAQSDGIRNEDIVFSVQGSEVHAQSDSVWHAGEQIEVTATGRFANSAGELSVPFVWRFRARPTSGTGIFGDTGQRLSTGGDPRDAALGDLDGDGDLDMLLAARGLSINQRNSLWLNDGDGTFQITDQQFGDVAGSSVVLGDIDGDGDLDAIMGRYGFGNQSVGALVWRNLGNGTFRGAGQRIGTQEVSHLAMGDVDGDGDLDVLAGTRPLIGERFDELWLNDGNGNFRDSGQRIGPASQAVALADIDSDGDLDALVLYRHIHAWLNDGSGNFSATPDVIGPSRFSTRISTGDLDADGDIDLLAGGQVLLNNGMGLFRETFPMADVAHQQSVLADVDGDGDLDILDPTRSQIRLNDGRGSFDRRTEFGNPRTDLAEKVVTGDLDGDGDIDALVLRQAESRVWLNADVATDLSVAINSGTHVLESGDSVTYRIRAANDGAVDLREVQVTTDFPPQIVELEWSCDATEGSVCQRNGQGQLRESVDLAAGGAVEFILTGTIESNFHGILTATASVASMGVQDIATANNFTSETDVVGSVVVSPKRGSHNAAAEDEITVALGGTLDPQTVSARSLAINASQSVTSLDAPDQLGAVDNRITFLRPNGFYPGESIQVTATNAIQSDFPEDELPLVWQFRVGAQEGTGYFRASGQSLSGTARRTVLGDVDGDGDLDALMGQATDARQLWLNDGTGRFEASAQTLDDFAAVALADIDGDGDLDAVGTKWSAPAQVWRNDGRGEFAPDEQSLQTMSARDLAFGDVDADGDLDLVFGEAGELWRNDGTGRFTKSFLAFEPWGGYAIALEDMDADGDLDVLFGGQNGLFLNDGTGNLSPGPSVMGPYRENDAPEAGMAQIGDVDNDGDPDIVVGINHIWLNDGAAHFQRAKPVHDAKYDPGIQVLGDFDGDDDLDLLGYRSLWLNDGFGNFTLRLLGGSISPVAIGDVNGDGALDILSSHFSLQQPSETRIWLNNAMPGTAVWDGSAVVGIAGDGMSWSDPNNWSVAGIPDELPAAELPADHVVFPLDVSNGTIQLDTDRTVSSIVFEGQTTLQGHSLEVVSEEIHVVAGADATIESRILSHEVRKSGEGTLTLPGVRSNLVVKSGLLRAQGLATNFHVQRQGTLSPGAGIGILNFDGYMFNTRVDGTLLAELAESNNDRLVGGTLVLGNRSVLHLDALVPSAQAGNFRRTIISSRVVGRFYDVPRAGQHVGSGVFVRAVDQRGTTVIYSDNGVVVALRQATAGDADGDGKFDQQDIVRLLQSNTYSTGQPAQWTEGDFNHDGLFDQADIVEALQSGSYRAD